MPQLLSHSLTHTHTHSLTHSLSSVFFSSTVIFDLILSDIITGNNEIEENILVEC